MKKNKRLKKLIVILFVLLMSFIYSSLFYNVSAENEDDVTQEILKEQSESIGITGFIEEANKYKNEDFNINVNELVESAIKGKIDNKTMGEKILSILFSQIEESIVAIR